MPLKLFFAKSLYKVFVGTDGRISKQLGINAALVTAKMDVDAWNAEQNVDARHFTFGPQAKMVATGARLYYKFIARKCPK